MNPALRFERTPDGQRELRERCLGLDARHRALLQQADGNKSLADLKRRLSSLMDVEQVIDELLRRRLLRSAAMMSADGAQPAVAPPPAAPAGDWRSISQRAGRALHELLGPDADELALRLERCRAADDLEPLLGRCRRLVELSGGGPALQRFESALHRGA